MSERAVTKSERALSRGLVGAQMALVAALVAPAGTGRAPVGRARRAVGLVLVAAGGGLGLAGARALGPALTPSPLPAAAAQLRTSGLYGRLRHPIYVGLTLAAAGRAIATGTRRHRVAAVALGGLLQAKARYEERRLHARFADYPAYATTTPGWVPRRRRQRRSQRCGS